MSIEELSEENERLREETTRYYERNLELTSKLYKTTQEIEKMQERIDALKFALRDAISTYGPGQTVLVSAERQEAWISALNNS